MKLLTYIVFVICYMPIHLHAQTSKPVNKVLWAIKDNKSGKEILTTYVIIGAQQIDSLRVLKAGEIRLRYGAIKENIVLDVTLKPKVQILCLDAFYKQRGIKSKTRSLPTSANGEDISDTPNVYVEPMSVKEVKVGRDSIRITTINGAKHINY